MIPDRRRLFRWLVRAAAWPSRVAAARAAMGALAAMDARELADIGLIRSDLRDVSALPLDRDPTELLARRARERRRGAHAPPTAPCEDDGRGRSVRPAPVTPREPPLALAARLSG